MTRFQLISISGKHKGRSWPLTDDPLVLGRGGDCDITIGEAVVSRRHCRICQQDSHVRFEDLGSRNPGLINGVPCEKAVLNVGDEISVGKELFLLTHLTGLAPSAGEPAGDSDTLSIGIGESLRLKTRIAEISDKRPVRTVHDLVDLYHVARDFSQVADLSALLDSFSLWIGKKFAPATFWVARVHGDGLSFYPLGDHATQPGADAPVKAIREALATHNGILSHESKGHSRVYTLVAPVTLSGVHIAAIALQRKSEKGPYSEKDLRFLVLLAQTLAPFIRALENKEELTRDNERLRVRTGDSHTLVGRSRIMGEVRAGIRTAAESDLNVLLLGETGTGKELAARLVHDQSARADGPFIVVNCAAIPRELMESQLFGHAKGAFTDAREAAAGLLPQAHGGTLFLDEVGDLSLDSQARILRAIEYGTFRPVGAEEEVYVDIRVVAATNQDIQAAIHTGAFREDLYHRLNGFEIRMPALRERPSDIPVLAEHFFEMAKGQAKRPLKGMTPDAIAYLGARTWSGNVRALRNCVLRAIAVARQESIGVEDVRIGPQLEASRAAQDEFLSMDEAEGEHIRHILERCEGNVQQAAGILRVGVSTLYKKLAKYGIER